MYVQPYIQTHRDKTLLLFQPPLSDFTCMSTFDEWPSADCRRHTFCSTTNTSFDTSLRTTSLSAPWRAPDRSTSFQKFEWKMNFTCGTQNMGWVMQPLCTADNKGDSVAQRKKSRKLCLCGCEKHVMSLAFRRSSLQKPLQYPILRLSINTIKAEEGATLAAIAQREHYLFLSSIIKDYFWTIVTYQGAACSCCSAVESNQKIVWAQAGEEMSSATGCFPKMSR